ncbi:MAG: PadR family transcriptional regulator [Acidobacteriota bacterium]
MKDTTPDILQGTLDLLILRALQLGPRHGWSISKRIEQVSQGVLVVQQGSLYPSLYRLTRRGWIEPAWGRTENNRRAKFYRLTELGNRQLDIETKRWRRLSTAVTRVLRNA